jgi:DNA-binding Lrp family transcriptional regulator
VPEIGDALVTDNLRASLELASDIFSAWRGERDAVDALILLAITRANVDGIVYSRELRARFGARNPIAPDNLRQPVSLDVLADSLRLPLTTLRRRVGRLEAADQCMTTPTGMLITERQVEASDRLRVVEDVVGLLRRAERELREGGFFEGVYLPEPAPQQPELQIRSSAAHGAKYVLRMLGSIAESIGDYVDALIVLELLRTRGALRTPSRLASAVGLPSAAVARRVGRLVSEGICTRVRPGRVHCRADAPWVVTLERRNEEYLFQLFAGLAEVGALDAFRAD